jgi:uncharacterized protein (TIGR02996 family)
MPAKPKSPFSSPAAVLPGEADILANVIADYSDHDAKLIYADWLEERDDDRGPLLRNFLAAYRAGKKLPPLDLLLGDWPDLVGLKLMALLHESPLAKKADEVLAFARPTVVHGFSRTAEKFLPVGTSRYGGRPDLPPKTAWPVDRGDPLTFIAQFNLAEIHASPAARELPAAGLLSLFCLHGYGWEFTKTNWRLLYFPGVSKLARRDPPPELPKKHAAPSGRMTLYENVTLPAPDSVWGEELLKALRRIDRDGTAYRNLLGELGGGDGLLGYPHTFEGDVLGKKSVRHLLTVGDGGDGWWPDGNMMYVTIPAADLKKALFDRAKATLQCF